MVLLSVWKLWWNWEGRTDKLHHLRNSNDIWAEYIWPFTKETIFKWYLFYFYRDSTLTLVSILSTSVCFLILAFILSLIGTQSSERRAEQSRAAKNPAAAARTAANNQYRYSNPNYNIWCWGAVMYFGIGCFSTYFATNRRFGQFIRYRGWACSKKSSVNRKCW